MLTDEPDWMSDLDGRVVLVGGTKTETKILAPINKHSSSSSAFVASTTLSA